MKPIQHRRVQLLFLLLGLIWLSACGAAENAPSSQTVPTETVAAATEAVIEASDAPTPTATAADEGHGEHGVEPSATAAPSAVPSADAPAHADEHTATNKADEGKPSPAATAAPSPSKPASTAAPAKTPEQTEAAEQDAVEHIVEIVNFAFSPSELEVKQGDRVKFVNKDEVRHSATADDNSFDTGLLKLDEAMTIEMTEAGEFGYYCLPHPAMRGRIIVTAHS